MCKFFALLTICVFVFKTGQLTWSGRNQEGAGTTAGEEFEMVNSYVSCCALTTKYMTKSGKLCVCVCVNVFFTKFKCADFIVVINYLFSCYSP